MALKAVDGTSTLDKVTGQLYEEVRSGRWPVGSRIPGEVSLSKQLQVSRPLVREAIGGLTRLGVLEPRRGSGTFVRSSANPADLLHGIDKAELSQILEVQMAYDVEAAGLAAVRRTPEDLTALQEWLHRRDEAADGRDPHRYALDDVEFHLAVAAAAHNPVLYELYRYFGTRLREGLYRVHTGIDTPGCGQRAHRAVFDAIRAGDASRARESAYHVVQRVLDRLHTVGDS